MSGCRNTGAPGEVVANSTPVPLGEDGRSPGENDIIFLVEEPPTHTAQNTNIA